MNSAQTKNKKISEYKIEDISLLFSDFFKKISSKIILLEIGTDFLNIGVAKSINNKLYIKKVFRGISKRTVSYQLQTVRTQLGYQALSNDQG